MAKLIIPIKELEYKDLPLVGGKAAKTRILTLQGINVPDALVLTGKLYDWIINGYTEIGNIIPEIKNYAPEEVEEYLPEIINQFRSLKFPDELINILVNRLPTLNFPHFCNLAIRPSPIFREMPTETFPGLHISVLNVNNFTGVLDAIKLLWASMWSLDAFKFRVKNCIPHEDMSMAIILQKMAVVDYSGIVWSRDPDNPSFVRIDTNWGIPDAIRTKQMEFDTILMKEIRNEKGEISFDLQEEIIRQKKLRLVFEKNTRVIEEIPSESWNANFLPPDEREQLSSMARKVEEIFGKPYNLLWVKEHKIQVLDAYAPMDSEESSEGWAVIVKSQFYPPVPSHFILKALCCIYKDGVNIMLREVGESDPILSKSITSMLGRPFVSLSVYSYLCSKLEIPSKWIYKIFIGTSLFPGIGEKPEDDVEFSTGILDSLKINRMVNRIEKIATEFTEKTLSTLVNLRKLKLSNLKLENIKTILTASLKELENIRDSFEVLSLIVFGLGMLKKLNPQLGSSEFYRQIPINTDICDVMYIMDFINLVETAINDPISAGFFYTYFKTEKTEVEKLANTNFSKEMVTFVEKYDSLGIYPLDPSFSRFIDEPSMLLGMIALLVNTGKITSKIEQVKLNFEKYDKFIVEDEQGFLNKLIPGRWTSNKSVNLLNRSILLARKHFEFHVDLISIIREVMVELGKMLYSRNVIEDPDDVFFLEPDEIDKITDVKVFDFKNIVQVREGNINVWEGYCAPNVFKGSRLNVSIPPLPEYPQGEQIPCIPVSGGRVAGNVKVIETPEDFSKVDSDDIIVVKKLNFVLAPLFLAGAGLIIEQNNPYLVDHTVCKILGLPAVSGIPGIADFLMDGDMAGIDGDEGVLICDLKER